ncbi:hypothetical protein WA577_007351, partial [Blastocystis sp. JDR]
SLQQSDEFVYHSIIRLTTLWFRVSQDAALDLQATVKEMEDIKLYQWYIVLQQLVAVAQHPSDVLKRRVSVIIGRVLEKYTEFVIWQIIGMLNNDAGVKRSFMMSIIQDTRVLNKKKRNVMEQAYQVSKALQSISRADKVNMNDV